MEVNRTSGKTRFHTAQPAPANQSKAVKIAQHRIGKSDEEARKMPPTDLGTSDSKATAAFKRALGKK